jgi:hypothetical protein
MHSRNDLLSVSFSLGENRVFYFGRSGTGSLTTAGMKRDSIWSRNECMKLPGTITNRMVIRTQFRMNSIRLKRKNTRPMCESQVTWYACDTGASKTYECFSFEAGGLYRDTTT